MQCSTRTDNEVNPAWLSTALVQVRTDPVASDRFARASRIADKESCNALGFVDAELLARVDLAAASTASVKGTLGSATQLRC